MTFKSLKSRVDKIKKIIDLKQVLNRRNIFSNQANKNEKLKFNEEKI